MIILITFVDTFQSKFLVHVLFSKYVLNMLYIINHACR